MHREGYIQTGAQGGVHSGRGADREGYTQGGVHTDRYTGRGTQRELCTQTGAEGIHMGG